jgi:hypothetical protein
VGAELSMVDPRSDFPEAVGRRVMQREPLKRRVRFPNLKFVHITTLVDTRLTVLIFFQVGTVLSMGDPTSAAPTPIAGAAKGWPKLVEADVHARIKDLAANPNKFDQGAFGLCTAAAFWLHVIQVENPTRLGNL